ncbi:DUF262 domain-containing protein [Moraxella osloensis]|jgi:uncharacterized protein with ParB-like and HNH nuclease domain|uniref:DUF262 domain-containing protein n=1 Tax=Faucicola osloensis TaxID=34062 RepID=UPI0034E0475B
MTDKIDSKMLPIKDIFKKWFCIPNYQRSYVWEKDQVSDLLDDIYEAYLKNKGIKDKGEYFLGSLVLKSNNTEDKTYVDYDVLDGQQRLTTLFLIIAVIRDFNTDCQKTASKFIYQEADIYENIPERSRIIFNVRDDVKKFIDKFVIPKNATLKIEELKNETQYTKNISIKNMANTIIFAHEYLKQKEIDDLFAYLCNNVMLIYVATENLDDAFKLFTVLNNRGIKLRNADILKADNLSFIPENLQNEFAKKWEEVESYFGEDFDKFLSHLQSILVKEKARLSLLDEFEKNIFTIGKIKKGEEFFNLVDNYKSNYEFLFDNIQDKKVKNLLTLMRLGFESDIWIAPLLKYYDKFKDEGLYDFIEKLNNKFASDWISGLTPTDRIKNTNAIISKIDEVQSLENLLNNTVLDIDVDELNVFFAGNVYGKRATRYVLLRLNYLYSDVDTILSFPDTISIEHILPQNPKEGSQWRNDFSEDERKEWTNKLGNLIILSRRKNSSQSNLDYQQKKTKYFKGNVGLGRSASIMSKDTWKLQDLAENHAEVLQKLKTSFGIN